MENIRGARLRKFNLRKIILGVRMHFRHSNTAIIHMMQNFEDLYHIPSKSSIFQGI